MRERLLAPSTERKTSDVVNIVNFIFGWHERDMAALSRKLQTPTTPPEETTPLEEETLKTYASLFREQREGTLYMGSKEASGYPQLADYLLCMRSRLHKLRPEVTLDIDLQYAIQGKGKQFYADGSLIATLLHNTRPVYVVDYKPRVPTHLEDIEPNHLSELFLQAFYLCNSIAIML